MTASQRPASEASAAASSRSSGVSSDAATPAPAASSSSSSAASTVDTSIASALAGMIARVPMHPIDTLKAKLQVQQHFRAELLGLPLTKVAATDGSVSAARPAAATAASPRSLAALVRHTVRAEGFRGL